MLLKDKRMKKTLFCLGLVGTLFCTTSPAADLDRPEVEKRLASADKTHPADLKRKDLTDIDLSNLNFTQADLWGSDLRRSNFNHSNLSGLNLDLSVLSKVNFSHANLSKTSIFGVHVGSANLSDADLSGTDLEDTNFSGANLDGTRFAGIKDKSKLKGLSTSKNVDKAFID